MVCPTILLNRVGNTPISSRQNYLYSILIAIPIQQNQDGDPYHHPTLVHGVFPEGL
jgi:hypothetical protein